jgi:hypothetical protein
MASSHARGEVTVLDASQRNPVDGGDALDGALADLARYGPELANGMTNHAPMVAEALDALSRPGDIGPWIDGYRAQLRPWPPATGGIGDWRGALGQPRRASDWRDAFERELAGAGWQTLLSRWVPRLAPGASAGALHGLIRVGHAARSLERRNSGPRAAELAAALASWAADYAELPVAPEHDPPRLGAAEALARLPLLPLGQRRNGGSIVEALAQLAGHEPFARAFHWFAVSDARAAAGELAEVFARVFLANVESPLSAIVFTHAITGTAAAGHLLPFVGEREGRLLVRHVWHAGCALYAAYAVRGPSGGPVGAATATPGDLVARALAHGDEHVVKLTEAVLALALEPRLSAAVSRRAMECIPPSSG